jgi:PPOX class probable F420-dependent enzyme
MSAMQAQTNAIDQIGAAKTILLTTYRRNGTPVGTAVHVVRDGDRLFMRTYDPSGKIKRLRHNPEVDIAPSTIAGQPTGPSFHAHAVFLEGEDAQRARQALSRKYPIAHRFLIPWIHRLRGYKTVQMELIPSES